MVGFQISTSWRYNYSGRYLVMYNAVGSLLRKTEEPRSVSNHIWVFLAPSKKILI
jgi:hypothetical protein